MTRAYQLFLLLYPREHRNQFADEMTRVFEEASAERRTQGWACYARFCLVEMTGLITGAAGAWLTRRPGQEPALEPVAQGALPEELIKAQQRVDFMVAAVVHAIAHHQFAKARSHSNQEREAREHLRLLREKYGITD